MWTLPGALSQQWWPLMHNEVGTTVGSIDLGYSYEPWHRISIDAAR